MEGEHGPGADDVGVGADGRSVGRVQRVPAAGQREPGRDAGQRVTGLHDVPCGLRGVVCAALDGVPTVNALVSVISCVIFALRVFA